MNELNCVNKTKFSGARFFICNGSLRRLFESAGYLLSLVKKIILLERKVRKCFPFLKEEEKKRNFIDRWIICGTGVATFVRPLPHFEKKNWSGWNVFRQKNIPKCCKLCTCPSSSCPLLPSFQLPAVHRLNKQLPPRITNNSVPIECVQCFHFVLAAVRYVLFLLLYFTAHRPPPQSSGHQRC